MHHQRAAFLLLKGSTYFDFWGGVSPFHFWPSILLISLLSVVGYFSRSVLRYSCAKTWAGGGAAGARGRGVEGDGVSVFVDISRAPPPPHARTSRQFSPVISPVFRKARGRRVGRSMRHDWCVVRGVNGEPECGAPLWTAKSPKPKRVAKRLSTLACSATTTPSTQRCKDVQRCTAQYDCTGMTRAGARSERGGSANHERVHRSCDLQLLRQLLALLGFGTPGDGWAGPRRLSGGHRGRRRCSQGCGAGLDWALGVWHRRLTVSAHSH